MENQEQVQVQVPEPPAGGWLGLSDDGDEVHVQRRLERQLINGRGWRIRLPHAVGGAA